MAHKERNQKMGNSIPGQYIIQILGCSVPLPTVEGKLLAFLCPFSMGFQLQILADFLDSYEHLRGHYLLHNTLVSQDELFQGPPVDAICRIELNMHFVHE